MRREGGSEGASKWKEGEREREEERESEREGGRERETEKGRRGIKSSMRDIPSIIAADCCYQCIMHCACYFHYCKGTAWS